MCDHECEKCKYESFVNLIQQLADEAATVKNPHVQRLAQDLIALKPNLVAFEALAEKHLDQQGAWPAEDEAILLTMLGQLGSIRVCTIYITDLAKNQPSVEHLFRSLHNIRTLIDHMLEGMGMIRPPYRMEQISGQVADVVRKMIDATQPQPPKESMN